MSDDPLRNPKDPLHKAGTDHGRELFIRLSRTATGFSVQDVLNGATNLIINAMREAYPTRDKAEAAYNEIMGKTKQLLLDHYDGAGRKRGIFPFDQHIIVPHHREPDKTH